MVGFLCAFLHLECNWESQGIVCKRKKKIQCDSVSSVLYTTVQRFWHVTAVAIHRGVEPRRQTAYLDHAPAVSPKIFRWGTECRESARIKPRPFDDKNVALARKTIAHM